MKKTNVLLLALLAFVCLFAVSCDGEPANPSKPDQPVTPPSGTSEIDLEKDQGINAYNEMASSYLSLMGSFEDQDLSALERNCKATFLDLIRDDQGEYTDAGKEALLYLAFAKKGKIDKLGDYTYIEVEGQGKLYRPHSIGNSQEVQDFEIEEMDVESVSFGFDKETSDSGICHVEFDNLIFTVKITNPVELSISVRIDLRVSVAVNKKEYSSSGDYWYYNPYEAFELDATLEGVSLPHYEFHFVEGAFQNGYRVCKYGDYERIWGYTISFDSNGGSSIDPISVGFGDSIDTSEFPIPTKGDYPFKGWFTKDGEPVGRYLTLNEDITLYARFFDDEAPNELEGEIYAMYKLACLLKENAIEESKADVQVQDLFRSETASKALFDMMLFLKGKTDSFGSKSYYITIEGKRYDEDYSSSHDFASDEISGKGWATYSEESEDSTKPTYKHLELESLSYVVYIGSEFVCVNNIYADLETWYEEGSDEYYAIALTIKDRSAEEVSHSFKLFCNTNKGVYDDYYFDSTRYNVTT